MSRAHYRRLMKLQEIEQEELKNQRKIESEQKIDDVVKKHIQHGKNLDVCLEVVRNMDSAEDFEAGQAFMFFQSAVAKTLYVPLVLNIFTPVYTELRSELDVKHTVFANVLLFGELLTDEVKLVQHFKNVLFCATPPDDTIHVIMRTHGDQTSYLAHNRNGTLVGIERKFLDQIVIDRLFLLGFKHIILVDNTCHTTSKPYPQVRDMDLISRELHKCVKHTHSMCSLTTDHSCTTQCSDSICPTFRHEFLPMALLPQPSLMTLLQPSVAPADILNSLIAMDDVFISQTNSSNRHLTSVVPLDAVEINSSKHDVPWGVSFCCPATSTTQEVLPRTLYFRTKVDDLVLSHNVKIKDNEFTMGSHFAKKGWHSVNLTHSDFVSRRSINRQGVVIPLTPKEMIPDETLTLYLTPTSRNTIGDLSNHLAYSDDDDLKFIANYFYDISSSTKHTIVPESSITRISITNNTKHCVDTITSYTKNSDGTSFYYPLFYSFFTSLWLKAVSSQHYLSLLHGFILTLDEFEKTFDPQFNIQASVFDSTHYFSTLDEDFTVISSEGEKAADIGPATSTVSCIGTKLGSDVFTLVSHPRFTKFESLSPSSNCSSIPISYTGSSLNYANNGSRIDEDINGSGFCYCCSNDKSHTVLQRIGK